MRKKVLLCLGALLFAGAAHAELSLVKENRPEGDVFLRADALPGEKTASEELKTYLKKISGAEFAVGTDPAKCRIVIGTADSPAVPDSMKKSLEGKEEEAFLLKTEGGKLYIVGKTQVGTLYGVYTFLEDFLNVRWFLPDEEYVEKHNEVVLPEIHLVSEPAFHWRTLSQVSAGGKARAGKTWAARNRLQCTSEFGIQALSDPAQRDYYDARIASHCNYTGGHITFYLAIPPQQYLNSHPEYFALVNGKRLRNTGHNNTHYCISNPEVQKLVADYICSLHEKYGRRITYLLGAPDTTINWCECDGCRALDEKGKLDVSRRFHTVAQKIAKTVYAKHPDAQLMVWAYANYRSLPDDLEIDPRMTVYFCTHGRCFAHKIDDPACIRNAEILDLMKKWLKRNPNMRLYEYARCTPMHWTPLEKTLSADLKTYRKMGIRGWKEEVSFPDANYASIPKFEEDPTHPAHMLEQEWLYLNVAGKLLWNPGLDVDKVIADIESKYYGKTYPVMKKFNDLRRAAWENSQGCFGYPTGDSRSALLLMKEGLKEQLLSLLGQAEKLAGNDPVLLRRLARDRKFLNIFWIKLNESYRARQGKFLNAPQAASPVVIDGNPEDPAWAGAAYLSDFKTAYGKEKNALPAELKTSVGILSDEKNLYFLILANEPATDRLSAKAEKDGSVWSDDSIEIFLDPHNNANAYYQIAVNSRGKVFDSRQPGNDASADFGVTAAARVEKNRYIIELKVPVAQMEGTFSPGILWGIHFARNRRIEDAYPRGSFSIDGEPYHQRSSYRTLAIGRPLLANGNFEELDAKTGKLKAWTLNQNTSLKRISDRKYNPLLNRGGAISQLIWDWKGPLGQSPEARPIRILFRASGSGILFVSAANYHDDWDGGKLKRSFFPTERITQVALTPEMKTYSAGYVIKPDRWIGLSFHTFGNAEIDNVSIVKDGSR